MTEERKVKVTKKDVAAASKSDSISGEQVERVRAMIQDLRRRANTFNEKIDALEQELEQLTA